MRALVYMVQRSGSIGAGEIAAELGVPPNYLGKILQRLGRAGIVRSRRGRRGGFAIRLPPEQITIAQIIGPLEDLSRHQNCVLGSDACDDNQPCPLHETWKPMREQFYHQIETMTLATVLSRTITGRGQAPQTSARTLISSDWLD